MKTATMKKVEVAFLARLDDETRTLGQRSIRVTLEVPEDMAHGDVIVEGLIEAGDPNKWIEY